MRAYGGEEIGQRHQHALLSQPAGLHFGATGKMTDAIFSPPWRHRADSSTAPAGNDR
jgi:hypothetical protein